MRFILLLIILMLQALEPVSAMALEDTAHLLRRTGFDAPPAMIKAYSKMSRTEAIDDLVDGATPGLQVSPPQWAYAEKLMAASPKNSPREVKKKERRALVKQYRQWWLDMQIWLSMQLYASDSPLTERMTLFWQNHFVSGWKEVRQTQFLFDQYILLRKNSLGSFAEMLQAIVRDPAMLSYLDNLRNTKNKPNENLARELLELFSLGEGNYSEMDIKEAARALTGWAVDRNGYFIINADKHDDGVKRFIGETGRFDAEDIVRIILQQDETAQFIVRKLWREFVSTKPQPSQVNRLAKVFRESDYQIRPLLKELLRTPEFWAEENRGVLIKSPLQLALGTIRALELNIEDGGVIVRAVDSMGQTLFQPPNVKGWPGGKYWIDSSSLLARQVFLSRITRSKENMKLGKTTMMSNKTATRTSPLGHFAPGVSIDQLQQMLLCCEPVKGIPTSGSRQKRIKSLLFDPVFQLY